MEEAEKFQLPENYTYLGENLFLKIKEIHTEEDALNWVKKLSEISLITWRVYKSYPCTAKTGRIYSFKKIYRCQHNTSHKAITSRVNKNTNCPAQMSIKIFRNYDVNQKDSWPCVVIFRNEHNHGIGDPSTLRFRPMSEETKDEILELFRKGHTPASAYTTYSMSKKEELGDEAVVDRRFCPSKNDVGNLWRLEFKKEVGENMLQTLEQYLKKLKDNGYHAEQVKEDNDYAIVICTPFMQRAHSLNSEIIFVDSTGKCGIHNHRVYMIATYCSGVGGLLLGCIIANSSRHGVFHEAMKVLVNFSSDAYEIEPKIILTDDDLGKRLVLHSIFPKAVLLLSTFHILKSCRYWLLNSTHKIPKREQRILFQSFESLVYCKTIDEFNYEEKNLNYEAQRFPLFANYIDNLLVRKKEWAHCFRSELCATENDICEVTEDMSGIFNDKHFKCTKTFNLIQLVKFLSTSFEKDYVQCVLDVIHGRFSKKVLGHLSDTTKSDTIVKVSDALYTIESETLKNVTYNVDLSTGVCSCKTGRNGQICKHQKAVISKCNVENVANTLSLEMREQLFWIASGKNCPYGYFQSSISNSSDYECNAFLLNTDSSSSTENSYIDEPCCENSVEDDLCWELSVEDEPKSPSYANALIDDICQKLKSETNFDPETMIPAIENFHKHFISFCNNQSTLLSDLISSFTDIIGTDEDRINKPSCIQEQKVPIQLTTVPREVKRRKKNLT